MDRNQYQRDWVKRTEHEAGQQYGKTHGIYPDEPIPFKITDKGLPTPNNCSSCMMRDNCMGKISGICIE